MARDFVGYDARSLKNHVTLDPDLFVTKNVEKVDDGGWDVTLAHGECVYEVYSYPGHEIDIEGVSRACFEK